MVHKTCEPLSIQSTLRPDLDFTHHNFTIAMHIGIALFKYVAVFAPQDGTILWTWFDFWTSSLTNWNSDVMFRQIGTQFFTQGT
jgi:hypothetical protein